MFSNRYRFLKMTLLLIMILCLCYYSYLNLKDSQMSLKDCIESPESCDKEEIVIVNKWSVRNISDKGFELSFGDRIFFVNDSFEGLSEGDYISAKAVFHKEGYVEIESLHVHKLLAEKWIVSLLATILVAFIFFRNYRFDYKKFEFRRR